MTSRISIGSGFGVCMYDHWNQSYFVVISCGVSLRMMYLMFQTLEYGYLNDS